MKANDLHDAFFRLTTELQESFADKIYIVLREIDPQKRHWNISDDALNGHGTVIAYADGCTIEKGGIATSCAAGKVSPELANHIKMRRPNTKLTADDIFRVSGISAIIHPQNPFVPSLHFNFRFFELYSVAQTSKEAPSADTTTTTIIDSWFGGGIDLSPAFVIDEDCIEFHTKLKALCSNFKHPVDYESFKKNCDNYFYVAHRKEWRGIGGIFFDDIPLSDEFFAFIQQAAAFAIDFYLTILARRNKIAWNVTHKEWQQIRRGRYVEFNLLYDRGTKFGLVSGGNAENILISMPPCAKWPVEWPPKDAIPADVHEQMQKAQAVFQQAPRDWASQA